MHKTQPKIILASRDSAKSGLVNQKSPPKGFRRVHHHERGRPLCGAVQSRSEPEGRRRPHSSLRTGKPFTWRRGPACWDFGAK
jgi:hypothetical protein